VLEQAQRVNARNVQQEGAKAPGEGAASVIHSSDSDGLEEAPRSTGIVREVDVDAASVNDAGHVDHDAHVVTIKACSGLLAVFT